MWWLECDGSAMTPNWSISFFLTDSVVFFSCQLICAVSNLIWFVRPMAFCFHCLAMYHCFCRQLFLGFRSFFALVDLGCLKPCFLDCCFFGFGFVFERICFSLRRLFLRCLTVGPSVPCFFLSLCVTCCSNLLYLSSSHAYLRSRLSHSFQIRSLSCS